MPKKTFEDDKEDWLITYADAITLLMAFFVMLLTFAKYDIPAFEEAAAAIKSKMSGRESTSPIQLLRIDVQDVVYNMQADQVVKVEKDDKGVIIELSSSAFYKPGSADIRQEAIPVLEKITQTLLAPRYQTYTIEIEGHTDDTPINTQAFPSNWELSSSRAVRVVRFFAENEIEPFRMKATGYADTKPKAPNLDPQGVPIPENRINNRRVAIRIFPMSLAEREVFLQKVANLEKQKESAGLNIKAPEADQAAPPEGAGQSGDSSGAAPPNEPPAGQEPKQGQ
ncbi:MAG: OmpA family protein [Rhodospirillales bacterium]